MTLKIIKKNNYKTTKWTGGETTELLIYPEAANLNERNFIFRVSSATCPAEKSKFSDFSGYNRYITSLNNDLLIENNNQEKILRPYEIFFFDGNADTASKSAVRDFNLIIKKGYTGSLRVESFEKEINFKNISGLNLIVCPEKGLELIADGKTTSIEPFDLIFINTKNKEVTLKSVDGEYTRIIIVDVEVD